MTRSGPGNGLQGDSQVTDDASAYYGLACGLNGVSIVSDGMCGDAVAER